MTSSLLSPVLGFADHGRRSLVKLVKSWLVADKLPATVLTLKTARKEWRLIAVNLSASILEALMEGVTLAVIFLSVEILTKSGNISWQTKPFFSFIAWLPQLASQLPAKVLFLCLLLVALLLQALQSFCRYINLVTAGLFASRVNCSVTALIHTQILSLSFACASRFRVGDLINTANTAPRAVESLINQLSIVFVNIVLAACYLIILLSLSPWLLLAALILGIILARFQATIIPRIKALSHKTVEALVDVSAKMTQDIQGLRLIHSSGLTQQASDDLDVSLRQLEAVSRRQAYLREILSPITTFLPILGITVIAGLSVILFDAKSAGILPSLVTFVLALQRLNGRFSTISSCFNQLAVNAGIISRLNLLLLPGDKEFRRQGGRIFQGLKSSITVENVTLCYSSAAQPALSHLNLVIPKGKTVALVGSSGSGKSSLADLLVGLYDPTQGEICLDGLPLKLYDLSSWQQRIGVVSQDTFLFNASLAENISYGSFKCSHEDIVTAARLAQADRFISQLPMGYETLVGERGYKLSGGQRQRISLARALLKRPEFLILDEATSALDSRNERLVQTAIEKLDTDITILIIAHRLSTIVSADLICVMEKGAIVEQGDHASLLQRRGKYYDLWQQQVGSHYEEPVHNF